MSRGDTDGSSVGSLRLVNERSRAVGQSTLMKTMIGHVAGLSWLTLPPVLLSALIHLTDPDVDGWRGIASPSVLWSVVILGALISSLIYLCLRALVDSGWSAFSVVTALVTLLIGVLLTMFGSGTQTTLGHLRTFAGCSAVIVLTVLLAVIPAAAVGWPGAVLGRRGRAAAGRGVILGSGCRNGSSRNAPRRTPAP